MQFNTLLFTFNHNTNLIAICLGFPGLHTNQEQPAPIQRMVVLHIKVFSNCQKHQNENNFALTVRLAATINVYIGS